LKPKALEVLPSDAEAPWIFKYWLATVETFVEVVACQHRNDPGVKANKRGLLVKLLSPTVYSYIEGRRSYEEALAVLKCVLGTFSRYASSNQDNPSSNSSKLLNACQKIVFSEV